MLLIVQATSNRDHHVEDQPPSRRVQTVSPVVYRQKSNQVRPHVYILNSASVLHEGPMYSDGHHGEDHLAEYTTIVINR